MATTPLNLGSNAPVLTPEMRAALLQAQQQQAMPTPVLPEAAILAATPAQQQLSRVQVDPVQQQAAALQAEAPQAQQKPGAVKSFLSNFLLGAGDGMRKHVGLPTEQEEARQKQQLAIQQQQADTQEAYRADQGKLINSHVEQLNALNQPFTFAADDESIPAQFRGQTMTTAAANGLRQVFAKNQGTKDVAQIKADAPIGLAKFYQENGGNPKMHQFRSVGGRVGLYDRQTGQLVKDVGEDVSVTQRAQALGISAANLGLNRQRTQGALYGTDLQGNALPGAAQIYGEDGQLHTVGLRFAPNAIKGNQSAAGFNDLVGSITHLTEATDALHDAGKAFSDPTVVLALQEAHGPVGEMLGSIAKRGLSPEQTKAVTSVIQAREQIGLLRSLTKGTAAEAQTTRALAALPGAGDPPALAQQKLRELPLVLDRLKGAITTVQGGVRVPGQQAPKSSTLPSTAPTGGGNDPFAAFGGRAR